MMLCATLQSSSLLAAARPSLLAARTGRALMSSIDYASLRGGKSFGREAGEWALQGEVPATSKEGHELATFAGGCFWGTELHFMRVKGVVATCAGYTQGQLAQPTYQQVVGGRTGHAEAVQVAFDPLQVSFSELCELLFRTIDPTLRDRVGNDTGSQYRHGIYPHTGRQESLARAVIATEQRKHTRPVVTELKPAKIFWPAEDEHQQFLSRGGRFGSPQSATKGCRDPVRCYG